MSGEDLAKRGSAYLTFSLPHEKDLDPARAKLKTFSSVTHTTP